MIVQYQMKTFEVSDALIDRLAEEVRLEIQRRKARAAIAQGDLEGDSLRMPIVLRGRANSSRGVFRSSRSVA